MGSGYHSQWGQTPLCSVRANCCLKGLESLASVCADKEFPAFRSRKDDSAVATAADRRGGHIRNISRSSTFEGAEAPQAIPTSVGCLDDLGGPSADVDRVSIRTTSNTEGANSPNGGRTETVQLTEAASTIVAL